MKKDTRKVTISYSYSERQDTYVRVPFIRLKGKWLSDAGFKLGQKVRVIADKRLTLIVEEPDKYVPNKCIAKSVADISQHQH